MLRNRYEILFNGKRNNPNNQNFHTEWDTLVDHKAIETKRQKLENQFQHLYPDCIIVVNVFREPD